MRFSSARMGRPAKIAVGAGLILWLWLLAAVLGFAVFDRDSGGLVVVGSALALFALSAGLLAWRRRLDWETGVYAVLTVGLLVALYNVPLRDDLPPEAVELAEDYSARHDDRYEFARALFWDISGRFTGPTREYLLQPQRIFLLKSATYYWETAGYVPSHLQSQLYRHLLIASGRFAPDEVKFRTGRCFNSPHGFLEITHPARELYADLWAAQNIDDYEFGQVVDMPSCDGLAAESEPEGEGLDAQGVVRPDAHYNRLAEVRPVP
jgi:hypothetical protein